MSKLYKFVLTLKEKHGCLNFYFLAVLTVKEVVLPLVSSSSLLIKSLWKILLINQVSPIKITDLFYKGDMAKNGNNRELLQQIDRKMYR